MSAPTVALVTADAARELDDDLPPLVAALADRVDVRVVSWDDGAVDWSSLSLAVVRSTWDYALRHDEFVDWVSRVDAVTTLENPAPVLRWNTDKRYLRDLASAGVPVVPTVWFAPGDDVDLPDHDELVVKPSVSSGARHTARYARHERDAAVAHVRELQHDGREVMVQPYLHAIDGVGETGVVHIDGHYSHGLRKGALLRPGTPPVDGLFAPEDMSAREPTAADKAAAARAIAAAWSEPLLYARVDLVPGEDGAPVVLELELTEPSLFFAYAPDAVHTLADAIVRRAT